MASHVCVLGMGLGLLNLACVVVVWYKVCIPAAGSPGGVRLPVIYLNVLNSLWGSDIGVQSPTRSTSGLASSKHEGRLGELTAGPVWKAARDKVGGTGLRGAGPLTRKRRVQAHWTLPGSVEKC